MRKSIVSGVVLAAAGLLAFARCGGSSGADAGVADVAAPGLDAQVAAQDGAVPADAGAADAEVEDAAVADTGPRDASLVPTPCTPVSNAGCDAGVCFVTSISPPSVEVTACGEPGDAGDYAPCTVATECQADFTCLPLPPDAGPVCHQYCSPALACPGTEALPENCISFTSAPTATGFCVRVPACSLFTQDCPGDAGVGCYPVSSGSGGCVEAGTLASGSPCTLSQQCAPGNLCAVGQLTDDAGLAISECRAICDPTGANTCGDRTCTQLLPHPWGFCK